MKLHPIRARILCGATVVASLAFTSSASAATLSLDQPPTQFTSEFPTAVDLTAEGTLDWAYWEYTGTGLASPLAPTNQKLGGSLISGASVVNDGEGANGSLRGSSATTVGKYNFSDGTTLLSGTNYRMAGLLFNSKIGSGAVGDGFSLQITGNPEEEQIVRLYLGGFGATGKLKLTLAGVTAIEDISQSFGVGEKAISIYTVRFRPDSITDLLTVTYTAYSTTPGNSNSHVGLEAVTVAAVPEPGSVVLLGIGGLALASRRRRRA